MKLRFPAWPNPDEGEHIATFGEARLVKHLNGKIELLGGSPDDRRAAKEWCSHFLHEAVVACTPQRISATLLPPRRVTV